MRVARCQDMELRYRSVNGYLVFVPALEIFTEGNDIPDVMEMARDAISLKCVSLEDDCIEFPPNPSADEAREMAGKYRDI